MNTILPQEFHFEDTADSVRVQTKLDKSLFDENMLMRHIRHFRLGAGTIIKIQFMSKNYDVLLHSVDYVIEHAVETMKRIVDERGERTAMITDYKIRQESEWKSYHEAPEPQKVEDTRVPEKYVPGEGEIKWNFGKKTYEILVGGEVVGEERDKEKALAIASGSSPLAA